MGKLTDKVAKGVFWVLMEKFGLQAVHFVVTLVLARLLTPNDYGTVALLSVFVSLSNVLVDSGFGKALVQKKSAKQTDYNTVFYLSVGFALVLYAGLFFLAPAVAQFYGLPELQPMLRVMAFSLIFHSINGVQNVELNRKMLFKLSFRISWARAGVSAAVGIAMAYMGYGPWALVWAAFFGGIASVIARQCVIAWRPSLSFSLESARTLFRFGWKVVVSRLIVVGYENLGTVLIGKFYPRADLACYQKGMHVPMLPVRTIDQSLGRVVFPALSKLQDNPERMRRALRKSIRSTTFFIFPMMAFCLAAAYDLVLVLFGAKWLPAAPFVAVGCLTWGLRPFNTINNQAVMACGRSGVALAVTVVRRLLGLAVILLTIRHGLMFFVVCMAVVTAPLGVVIISVPTHKYLGYSLLMQIRDVLPSFFLSAVAGAAMSAFAFLPLPPVARLACMLMSGAAVYGTLAWAFRLSVCSEIAQALLSGGKRFPKAARSVLEAVAGWCREGVANED